MSDRPPTIRRATRDDLDGLCDLLLDVVEGGASVGFMSPLSRERAAEFWRQALSAADAGRRVVLVADDDGIVGTVSLVFAQADNQPHRADVAKMQVHSRARRRGVGEMLLKAVEAEAVAAGKTLLVLDTVSGSDAERLYLRLGWVRVGEIPRYALFPGGGECATTYFYRDLSGHTA